MDVLGFKDLRIEDDCVLEGEMIPALHIIREVSRSQKKVPGLGKLKAEIPDDWAAEILDLMLRGHNAKSKHNYFLIRFRKKEP